MALDKRHLHFITMKTKKISLEAFSSKELSAGEKKLIMAGSGTTVSTSWGTYCSGSDSDGNSSDSD
jgi:hypothetical protein